MLLLPMGLGYFLGICRTFFRVLILAPRRTRVLVNVSRLDCMNPITVICHRHSSLSPVFMDCVTFALSPSIYAAKGRGSFGRIEVETI